ncbi:MAG: hypothetical protein QOC62_6245 [Mycobacterium sp.]|jgi:hypothetical protein|nr:hypothetical protein [Mycobacterium sp.]
MTRAVCRCAQCGHIGCCDNSPGQHATAHADATGHPWITSYEPEEHWFYDYRDQQFYDNGPQLTPPDHHPLDQPTPGPAGARPCQLATAAALTPPNASRGN